MRALWMRCCTGKANAHNPGPMREADLLAVLHTLTGRSWAKEIKAWAHGTRDLPLAKLLTAHGVKVQQDAAPLAQRLGLRVSEDHSVQIKTVLHGGPAHHAGFAPGDEWLGLEVGGKHASAWRMRQLNDLQLYAGEAKKVMALVSRDRQLLRLTLTLPTADSPTVWRLLLDNPKQVQHWLSL
jgi:predicted metalloprotease with PDZ domain